MQAKTEGLPRKTWSSVVAQAEQKPSFSLDYFSSSPPKSDNGSITIKPPVEILNEGNNLWYFFSLLRDSNILVYSLG